MAFHVGKNCQIHPSAVINVKEGFLGDGAIIRDGVHIEGERVEIGREAFLDRGATIGGGSCFDPCAYLTAGDWFHMGANSQINTARGVKVGHELGCGIETKIFTHGAYLDSLNLGAPVQWEKVEIGDSVWLPNAWVNPGVSIGSNVVVAARSLVNKNLPEGCLAGGIPVQIIKEKWLPRELALDERIRRTSSIIQDAWRRNTSASGAESPTVIDYPMIVVSQGREPTVFNMKEKTIVGPATPWAILLKDQLRRNGIRFRYQAVGETFIKWKDSITEI